jgi:hypothetical protein
LAHCLSLPTPHPTTSAHPVWDVDLAAKERVEGAGGDVDGEGGAVARLRGGTGKEQFTPSTEGTAGQAGSVLRALRYGIAKVAAMPGS